MYKLMIVDDEPLFTDGLAECLRDLRNPEWEIYKAYNAREALRQLERTPVDVLLLDIRMPGMSGLELHREIQHRWPKCKVLFLTGHDEFGYIQEALRQGTAEYILKMEGDEVIIAALGKIAGLLEAETLQEQWMTEARSRLQQAKASLHKSFVLELIGGELESGVEPDRLSLELADQLNSLDIPLDPQKPVLLVLGKIDHWQAEVKASDRALFLFAVQNIAHDLLNPTIAVFSSDIDRSHILWFMQAKSEELDAERALTFTQGIMAQVQEKASKLFKLDMSIVIGSHFDAWPAVHIQYYQLKNKLFRHFGLQKQLFLVGERQSDSRTGGGDGGIEIEAEAGLHHTLNQLKFALEHNQQEQFRQLLMQLASPDVYMQARIYFGLAAIALDTIQQWELREEVEARFDLFALFVNPPLEHWDRFLALYGELMELLFAKRFNQWEQQGMNTMMRIKLFLARELHADLSLNRIAEQFSYHPAYLSRLYKQLSGHSLSEEIAAMRLQRAQELLPDKQLKINEVGKAAGFESPRYFTKFFKAQTGMTPQEFRDRY